ncbi:MAG: hypothetical protein Q4B54_13405, partial [Coriobacteriales bacterium]|nr:hypothetical protein [Coriobacteriales bacterium]
MQKVRNISWGMLASATALCVLILLTGCSALPKGLPFGAAGEESGWVLTHKEEYAYDGEMVTVTTSELDERGREVSRIVSRDGAVSEQWAYSYRDDGRMEEQTQKKLGKGAFKGTATWRYEDYDAQGRPLRIASIGTDADGNVSYSTTCQMEYGPDGEPKHELSLNEDGTLNYSRERVYDAEGNCTEIHYSDVRDDGTTTSSDVYYQYESGRITYETHYRNGELEGSLRHDWQDEGRYEFIASVDEEGNTHAWEAKYRDDAGNLLYWEKDSGAAVWGYAYDEAGRVLEEVHWRDGSQGSIDSLSRNYYDSYGNLINVVEYQYGSTSCNYTTCVYANVAMGLQSKGALRNELEPQYC